jgi:peptidoglycan hydrolase FlgJ
VSIFPATDIVSDVARAADPRRVRTAMQRLERAAAPLEAPPPNFDPLRFADRPSDSRAFIATYENSQVTERRPESPGQKFEAFLLGSWLEMLLPKEEAGVFGMGGAGDVWRSLMAEQLGAQLAGSGGIGVQKLIDQSYAPTTDTRA